MDNEYVDPRDIEPEYGSDDWASRRGYEIAQAFGCTWDEKMQQADDIAAVLIELRDKLEQAMPQPMERVRPELRAALELLLSCTPIVKSNYRVWEAHDLVRTFLDDTEDAPTMEIVPDGLYCDDVLAIQSFTDGHRDIGIKIDNSFAMDTDDWVNNYEWLAGATGKGLPKNWQLMRPTPTGQEVTRNE